MLVDEPVPTLPTISSRMNRSAGVLTAAAVEATQTRPGNEVAPSQMKRRGSASMLGSPMAAWLGRLREIEAITVPSRGARLESELAATTPAACGLFRALLVC